MFVIADDLIGGSFVFHRQPSAAPAYLQQLLAKTRSAHAPHACQALAQRLNHGGGQGFARSLRHFPRQTIRLGILDAQCDHLQENVLRSCSTCHSAPGIRSVLSFARISFDQRLSAPRLSESDPRASLHGTVNLNSCQYGLLRGLWGH